MIEEIEIGKEYIHKYHKLILTVMDVFEGVVYTRYKDKNGYRITWCIEVETFKEQCTIHLEYSNFKVDDKVIVWNNDTPNSKH